MHLGWMHNDGQTDAAVAIKVLHPHLAHDPDAVALFVDEARVAGRIRHPNVVPVRDVDMVGSNLVIIMDYVEGIALSSLLRGLRERRATIPIPAVARIIAEALRGLHAAHEAVSDDARPMAIVHRDVSPHNILIGTDGITRVTDFGVATSVGRLAHTRTDGLVRGKLHYLAPEQIHRKDPDRSVDIWAAGVVLWECLTGIRLFAGGTEAETLSQILRQPIEPPSMHRHGVPVSLDDVCLRALERDPARRFSTAAEFADALEGVMDTSNASATISSLIFAVDGDAIHSRRSIIKNGPQATAPLGDRFAFTSATVGSKPHKSGTLTLLLVCTASLVLGGVAVKFTTLRDASQASAQTVDTTFEHSVPSFPEPPSPPISSVAGASASELAVAPTAYFRVPATTTASSSAPTRAPVRTRSRDTAAFEKRRNTMKAPASASQRPFMPDDL